MNHKMEVLTSVMRSCEIKLRITKKEMSTKLAPSCLPHPSHNLTSLSERKMGSSSASFAQKTLFWKRTTFCYLLDQVIEWMDVMKIVALSLSFVSLSLLYLPSILPEKRLLFHPFHDGRKDLYLIKDSARFCSGKIAEEEEKERDGEVASNDGELSFHLKSRRKKWEESWTWCLRPLLLIEDCCCSLIQTKSVNDLLTFRHPFDSLQGFFWRKGNEEESDSRNPWNGNRNTLKVMKERRRVTAIRFFPLFQRLLKPYMKWSSCIRWIWWLS